MSNNRMQTCVALVCFAMLLAAPVNAQVAPAASQETLEQRVARLEQLVAELTRQLQAASGAKVEAKAAVTPEIQAVVKAEVKAEIANEVRADVRQETDEFIKQQPTVGADTSGFTIKSADGNFALKIRSRPAGRQPHLSAAQEAGRSRIPTLLRRVRPTFSGTVYKYVDFYFRPDFGQGTTVIYDAYLELRYWDFAKLRVGKFKPPVGLERLQSDDDTNFVERGLPTLLVPSRDIGYQLAGDLLGNRLSITPSACSTACRITA